MSRLARSSWAAQDGADSKPSDSKSATASDYSGSRSPIAMPIDPAAPGRAGRVELPVREPAVLDCLGGANLVVEDAGDVVGVDVLRAGIFAQLCELLFDSAGILNGQLSTPLEGCHRVGDLQPLSGGVDQLG